MSVCMSVVELQVKIFNPWSFLYLYTYGKKMFLFLFFDILIVDDFNPGVQKLIFEVNINK